MLTREKVKRGHLALKGNVVGSGSPTKKQQKYETGAGGSLQCHTISISITICIITTQAWTKQLSYTCTIPVEYLRSQKRILLSKCPLMMVLPIPPLPVTMSLQLDPANRVLVPDGEDKREKYGIKSTTLSYGSHCGNYIVITMV